ncbi:pyridoxamine 5'-phosphate oxidase family protein [Alkalicoccus urumqiensis]|uniref:General stress protein n=1 Tax=Alkalicoccus urumqiensis TaxID=1548213 RepID=A0A2P6MJQ3_ALKUR|nr:pyridoxamine 5'-phosphate oxidase family protein [Alkalicoccus urumqiensis]PRO66503.1 general stress protein [Alkalicoccus urumqiensis]
MDQKQLRERIESIMEQHAIGTLATVENDKPHTRYMTFLNKDLTLYTPTSRETHKAEEIDKNNNVHILLGYQGDGIGDEFVEVAGTASIRDDKNLVEDLWFDDMNNWFGGKEDPELIFLEIKPDSIRLMNKKGEAPKSLDL